MLRFLLCALCVLIPSFAMAAHAPPTPDIGVRAELAPDGGRAIHDTEDAMTVGNAIELGIQLPDVPAGLDFPATTAAVRDAGALLQAAWTKLADGTVLGRFTGAYVNGLRQPESLEYPFGGDGLAVGVFNVAEHAGPIEHGYAAFNLAERVAWGSTPKSRLSKKGVWYVRIPFRHYTPAGPGEGATPYRTRHSMSHDVYRFARELKPGQRLHVDLGRMSFQTASNIADPRLKSAGSFQASLEAAKQRRAAAPPAMHRASGHYQGMFVSGATRHRQYMTIRTLTQDSEWWVPAQPGKHIARSVAEQNEVAIRSSIEAAFAKDVERAVALGLTGQV